MRYHVRFLLEVDCEKSVLSLVLVFVGCPILSDFALLCLPVSLCLLALLLSSSSFLHFPPTPYPLFLFLPSLSLHSFSPPFFLLYLPFLLSLSLPSFLLPSFLLSSTFFPCVTALSSPPSLFLAPLSFKSGSEHLFFALLTFFHCYVNMPSERVLVCKSDAELLSWLSYSSI